MLLTNHDKFDSFGFEAEENYVATDEDEEDEKSSKKLFRNFKMVLNRKEVKKN